MVAGERPMAGAAGPVASNKNEGNPPKMAIPPCKNVHIHT